MIFSIGKKIKRRQNKTQVKLVAFYFSIKNQFLEQKKLKTSNQSVDTQPPRNIMTHMIDSLLASPNGQGEVPRKKDQARELQQRIEAIARDAKVKIVKLKRLIAFSLQQFEARFTCSLDDKKMIDYVEASIEANDILDKLNVNDRYEDDKDEELEKLETLIYKIWEDEYGDQLYELYDQLQNIFIKLFFINTQETQKKYHFIHADNTHSEKENDNTHIGKGTRIHDNKSNDKLDNAPEACKFKDCKFIVFISNLKKSKIRQ